jgi:hypothetical protein
MPRNRILVLELTLLYHVHVLDNVLYHVLDQNWARVDDEEDKMTDTAYHA